MNFLAHTYLSDNEKVQIGNFIGDYVKGKDFLQFPEEISKGILLHRKIDYYTDSHFIIKETKRHFSEKFRLYSGIIVDMVFDHFLAKNWNEFHPSSLEEYCQEFYSNLNKHYKYLPKKVQDFTPFMIRRNRLLSYREISGIQDAIQTMTNYTSLPDFTEWSIEQLKANYFEIEESFRTFMKDIMSYLENEALFKNKKAISRSA